MCRGRFGIWRSDDNGANWVYDSFSESELFKDVTYDSSSGRFVAVAGAGHVFYSSDSGSSWNPGATGVSDNLTAVTSNGSGVLIAVGANGRILRSTDGGVTWTPGSAGTNYILYDVGAR